MEHPVNLMAPHVQADIFPVYAELRRQRPVCQVEPGGMWAVTRYADALHVLRTPEIFSSKCALVEPEWLGRNPMGSTIVFQDPPFHTKLRGLLAQAFNPRGLAHLEARIRVIVAELVGRLLDRDEIDFVDEFATMLPGMVICELLGLDLKLYKHFKRWAYDIASITPVAPSPERIAEIRATIGELEGYLGEVIENRRRAPTSDPVSSLVHAEFEGASLTRDELVSSMFTLLSAGFETTQILLGNAMLTLTERPADLARLRADPAKIPAFLEEVLRHRPPTHGIFRITTADAEVAGTTIPQGSMVYVLLGSALHDEREFPDPERFDMDRGTSSNMAFGHGIHFCIGAPLGRLEARIALEALLSRFSSFTVGAGGGEWRYTIWNQALSRLPVRLARA